MSGERNIGPKRAKPFWKASSAVGSLSYATSLVHFMLESLHSGQPGRPNPMRHVVSSV